MLKIMKFFTFTKIKHPNPTNTSINKYHVYFVIQNPNAKLQSPSSYFYVPNNKKKHNPLIKKSLADEYFKNSHIAVYSQSCIEFLPIRLTKSFLIDSLIVFKCELQ